jgi:hypothetical protein
MESTTTINSPMAASITAWSERPAENFRTAASDLAVTLELVAAGDLVDMAKCGITLALSSPLIYNLSSSLVFECFS